MVDRERARSPRPRCRRRAACSGTQAAGLQRWSPRRSCRPGPWTASSNGIEPIVLARTEVVAAVRGDVLEHLPSGPRRGSRSGTGRFVPCCRSRSRTDARATCSGVAICPPLRARARAARQPAELQRAHRRLGAVPRDVGRPRGVDGDAWLVPVPIVSGEAADAAAGRARATSSAAAGRGAHRRARRSPGVLRHPSSTGLEWEEMGPRPAGSDRTAGPSSPYPAQLPFGAKSAI